MSIGISGIDLAFHHGETGSGAGDLVGRRPEAIDLVRLNHHQDPDQAAASICLAGEIPDSEVMLSGAIGFPFEGIVGFDECLEQLVGVPGRRSIVLSGPVQVCTQHRLMAHCRHGQQPF